MIKVDPAVADPHGEIVLDIFGRNLSAQTKVAVDLVPATIIEAPDAWHLFVKIPAGALGDGNHDILLVNPNGQSDRAMGALVTQTPGLPVEAYLVGLGLIVAFVLYRGYRGLTG